MKARIERTPIVEVFPFTHFEPGDFLVSTSGLVGIKTSGGHIVWVSGAAGYITYAPIPTANRYSMPRDVLVML